MGRPVRFQVGDLVTYSSEPGSERAGIVAQPVTDEPGGTILICEAGTIETVGVTSRDVTPAIDGSTGWTQLARLLLTLGSKIIEDRLTEDSPHE